MFIIGLCAYAFIQFCKIPYSVIMTHLCLDYIHGKLFTGTFVYQLMKFIIYLYSWNIFHFFVIVNKTVIKLCHLIKHVIAGIFKYCIHHSNLKTFSDKPFLLRTLTVNTGYICSGLRYDF